MSAGKDAIPMWKENIAWKKSAPEPVTCWGCNWKGPAYELLVEPDNQTMYCPQCGTSGWVFD